MSALATFPFPHVHVRQAFEEIWDIVKDISLATFTSESQTQLSGM